MKSFEVGGVLARRDYRKRSQLGLIVSLGGVDSKDPLLGANQIQDCFWGGSLGRALPNALSTTDDVRRF